MDETGNTNNTKNLTPARKAGGKRLKGISPSAPVKNNDDQAVAQTSLVTGLNMGTGPVINSQSATHQSPTYEVSAAQKYPSEKRAFNKPVTVIQQPIKSYK